MFISNWIKKRRESRAKNVTLQLRRVRKADKPLIKEPFMRRLGRTQGRKDSTELIGLFCSKNKRRKGKKCLSIVDPFFFFWNCELEESFKGKNGRRREGKHP